MLVTKMEIIDSMPYCSRGALPVSVLARAHWLDTTNGEWNVGTVDVLVCDDGVCYCHRDFEGARFVGIDDAYEDFFVCPNGWSSLGGVDWHSCYVVSGRDMRHNGFPPRNEYVWLAELGQWVALYGEEIASDNAFLRDYMWHVRAERVSVWRGEHASE